MGVGGHLDDVDPTPTPITMSYPTVYERQLRLGVSRSCRDSPVAGMSWNGRQPNRRGTVGKVGEDPSVD